MSMTTPYCEKHEWPGGMDRPCPDCDELAKVTAERDAALLQVNAMRPVVEAALAYEVSQETWDRLEKAIEDYKATGVEKPKCGLEREDGSPCEGFVPCPRHFREQNMKDYLERRVDPTQKEWALCGWCACGHDAQMTAGVCPKCKGAGGLWVEPRA